MGIAAMSASASLLILAVAGVRAIGRNTLPKLTFVILWTLVLVRLLVPYSLPFQYSLFSLMGWPGPAAINGAGAGIIAGIGSETALPDGIHRLITGIWLCGVIAGAFYFCGTHWRWRQKYKVSLPVHQEYIQHWLASHKTLRSLTIRQSDQIPGPLTYGLWKPVILLPSGTDWSDTAQLRYVLAHEYTHVRRFDTLLKYLLAAACCLHWFNPLVWYMYGRLNRDIELSCDETVVNTFGTAHKPHYARALLHMAEKRVSGSPLSNSFTAKAMEERILSIMRHKPNTAANKQLALLVITGISLILATVSVCGPDERSIETKTTIDVFISPSEGDTASTYIYLSGTSTEE
ncbi:M56 family metallopeptidase [Paenibacillus sp. FSL K6-1096]|uniref:M56 family metallopeptidase n=1 Tax=Paenibacillus sp. FSL K6-1096 TaxID=2921460 RepID=UPI0030EC9C65